MGGAGVAVGYRSGGGEGDETLAGVKRLRRPAIGVAGDLGDPAAAGRAVDDAVQGLGGLDLLIVNHGIWPPDEVTVAAMTDAQWDATRRANLDSVLYVCRAAIPLLPDGGKIVLVSSTAGQRGEPFHADYAATKGAVISFTKSLAVELAPRRINVNCVAPGWVDTEMSATPYAKEAGRGKEDIERTIPLGRVASPEDCAGPIVFLCSDLAGHITGEILNVNGCSRPRSGMIAPRGRTRPRRSPRGSPPRKRASRRWGRDGARGCRFCKWKCGAGTAAHPGSR